MASLIIDGHRHLLCPQAHELAHRLDPVRAMGGAGAGSASGEVKLERAPTWARKMTNLEEHVSDLSGQGIDIGVIWLSLPQIVFSWDHGYLSKRRPNHRAPRPRGGMGLTVPTKAVERL